MKKTIITAMLAFMSIMGTIQASTYYVSPTGNDQANGTSTSTPWASFGRAWQDLYPGDTLFLMDGTYHQTLAPNVRNGTPNPAINTQDYQTHPLDDPQRTQNYIRIRALNDGKAVIDGQNQRMTIMLGRWEQSGIGSYYLLEGLVARNSSDHVYLIMSHNVVVRRCSGYNANTNTNSHVFMVFSGGTPQDPSNILVEDCVAGGSGRKMFVAYTSYVNVIFRRLFAAWQEWQGATFNAGYWPWGDGIEIYNYQQTELGGYPTLTNSIVENSVLYGVLANYGFSLTPNPTVTRNNNFLGLIAIQAGMKWNGTPMTWPCPDPYNSSVQCTKWGDYQSLRAGFVFGTFSRPLFQNNRFQDLFAYANGGAGLSAGEPTQGGGWCDGTEAVGHYPCSMCNAVETNPADNCTPGQVTPPRASSNNTLNRVTLLNNGLGSPPPQEGAGTEVTDFSLSMFDRFGSKSNLYIEGRQGYTDPSKGARLQHRYVNGVLMDGTNGQAAQSLWPWPMEDRIKSEFATQLLTPVSNFSVTNTICEQILKPNGAVSTCGQVSSDTTPPAAPKNFQIQLGP